MTKIHKMFSEGQYRAVVGYCDKGDYPESLEDLIDLGYSYLYLSQYDDALNIFMHAIKTSPQNVELHLATGQAYRRLHLFDQSAEELKKATFLAPDFADAYVELATLYRETGQRELENEALQIVEQLAPNSFNLAMEAGNSAYNQGQYVESIGFYRNAWNQNKNSPDANYGLALAHMALKKARFALPYMDTATHFRPDWIDALYTSGLVYTQLRDYRKAIQLMNKVISINPQYRAAYVSLVGLNIICGNWRKAWRLFQVVQSMPIESSG